MINEAITGFLSSVSSVVSSVNVASNVLCSGKSAVKMLKSSGPSTLLVEPSSYDAFYY